MAWTTPETFTAGQTLTAASMNAISGNLDVLDSLRVLNDAWTSYTPSWSNLTVGNGTNESAYIAIGKTYFVRIKFTLGSTSSISGSPEFTLPGGVSLHSSYNTTYVFGAGGLKDASAGQDWDATLMRSGATSARIRFLTTNVSGTYPLLVGLSAAVPFTWTTSDILTAHLFFEAA